MVQFLQSNKRRKRELIRLGWIGLHILQLQILQGTFANGYSMNKKVAIVALPICGVGVVLRLYGTIMAFK